MVTLLFGRMRQITTAEDLTSERCLIARRLSNQCSKWNDLVSHHISAIGRQPPCRRHQLGLPEVGKLQLRETGEHFWMAGMGSRLFRPGLDLRVDRHSRLMSTNVIDALFRVMTPTIHAGMADCVVATELRQGCRSIEPVTGDVRS